MSDVAPTADDLDWMREAQDELLSPDEATILDVDRVKKGTGWEDVWTARTGDPLPARLGEPTPREARSLVALIAQGGRATITLPAETPIKVGDKVTLSTSGTWKVVAVIPGPSWRTARRVLVAESS